MNPFGWTTAVSSCPAAPGTACARTPRRSSPTWCARAAGAGATSSSNAAGRRAGPRQGDTTMTESLRDRAAREVRYDALTWPEINEAVALKKVVVLPIGATEQHGPHLPLETDTRQVRALSLEAASRSPEDMLVLPEVAYGYTHHVMDFPGTVNVEPS